MCRKPARFVSGAGDAPDVEDRYINMLFRDLRSVLRKIFSRFPFFKERLVPSESLRNSFASDLPAFPCARSVERKEVLLELFSRGGSLRNFFRCTAQSPLKGKFFEKVFARVPFALTGMAFHTFLTEEYV